MMLISFLIENAKSPSCIFFVNTKHNYQIQTNLEVKFKYNSSIELLIVSAKQVYIGLDKSLLLKRALAQLNLIMFWSLWKFVG